MRLMPTVAYITNQFPSAVEWYVVEEIRELERRGVEVIPCSARRTACEPLTADMRELREQTICLQAVEPRTLLRAVSDAPRAWLAVKDLVWRALSDENTAFPKRLRMLIHTACGLYLAALLQGRSVQQIHVHHGYFSAWIAMVAAQIMGVPFSMTLHGSDLLRHATFMEIKLSECSFCLTISEFNRQHILAHYPTISPGKIHVQRLGVKIPPTVARIPKLETTSPETLLLAVGRLDEVKNHSFLVQACYLLREWGMKFRCIVAGEGPERGKLQFLIEELALSDIVTLPGHQSRDELSKLYESADLVVLTSHSEGIPLVLMEAMAREKVVLAPAITGIPELVIDGKTGFLYRPGSLEEFVWRAHQICSSLSALDTMRQAARRQVIAHFNGKRNLEAFGNFFVEQIAQPEGSPLSEDLVLQQI